MADTVDKENSENLENLEDSENIEKEEIIDESVENGKSEDETGEADDKAPEPEKEKDKSKERKKDIKKLDAELEQKKEEYDILYDKYLRINAEYDNFRKRTTKEKEGIYSDAVIDVLNNILPNLDNIERAIQFAANTEPEKFAEGVKMIHSQFMSSLAKIGVEEIKAEGEQFNPEIHNAVFHEEDENQPDNTVTEVLQKGYIKGEKVIRPAMVKVVN